VELCTELFYDIIPTLFLCFLLICYPYIMLQASFIHAGVTAIPSMTTTSQSGIVNQKFR